jgi:nucleoporin GLE1
VTRSFQSARPPKTDLEAQRLADALASIRLRTRHHDAYEVWANAAKKDALVRLTLISPRLRADTPQTAAKQVYEEEARAREAAAAQREALLERERGAISARAAQAASMLLQSHATLIERENAKLRSEWSARDSHVKNAVELAIQKEEARLAQLERAKREKEEKDRREREAAEKARLEAEKKKREEEEKRRREAEEKKRKEEEEKRRAEEEERRKEEERLKEEEERRQKEESNKKAVAAIGMSTSAEDWKNARETLLVMLSGRVFGFRMAQPLF